MSLGTAHELSRNLTNPGLLMLRAGMKEVCWGSVLGGVVRDEFWSLIIVCLLTHPAATAEQCSGTDEREGTLRGRR